MEYYEKFEKLREFLGDKIILENVLNYFDSDQIDEFCNSTATDYDCEDIFEE